MLELAILTATMLAALVVFLVLRLRGHRVSSATLNLPFAQINMKSFAGLSPVKRFNDLSILCIPARPMDSPMEDSRPIILVHVGWNLVCDAFVRRFERYPDDETLSAAARELGGQNVEFVRMYRDIYEAAIRSKDLVPRAFAANYLVRAPALAERVSGTVRGMDQFVVKFLQEAESALDETG